MMNKILITVKVPMIEREYDVYIPVSKNVKVTTELLIKTINELSEGHFPKKQKATLMLNDGTILKNESIIKECGLKNADIVIMI